MIDQPILTQLFLWVCDPLSQKTGEKPPDLHTFWQSPELLPAWVADSPTALRYLDLLGPLRWGQLPERNLERHWRHTPVPFATFIACELVRLNEGLRSTADLHRYLREHPALRWLLGWQPAGFAKSSASLNTLPPLPTQRHFSHLLRKLPNAALQYLLADSAQLIRHELATQGGRGCGDCIALDTKHILAWVKENNPKAYLVNRFNPTQPPVGDRDCRLGCKRQRNQLVWPPTPTRNPAPANTLKVGEYHWGYASGCVVAPVPPWGEFVLAELTLPFDQGDLAHFFPLMRQVEERLGYRPHFGLFDAAFDAWYVYAYFHRENDPAGGVAIVPFSEKGGYKAKGRQFSPEGLPLCAARWPMPLQFTYTDRTSCLIEHERGKYVCPLRFPQALARACPIRHPNWQKGGCTAMMPTSVGARLRYTLNRDGDEYKQLYRQRTAVERINSQAVALGIERPHWRNGRAIANQNTLIYLLINLRFLQRLYHHRPAVEEDGKEPPV